MLGAKGINTEIEFILLITIIKMYVKTEKATIRQRIKELEQLKKDKELLLSDYNGLLEDKRKLEKENKELKENFRYYKTKSEFLNKVIVKYQDENEELKKKMRS